jgi:hypothetical protein
MEADFLVSVGWIIGVKAGGGVCVMSRGRERRDKGVRAKQSCWIGLCLPV